MIKERVKITLKELPLRKEKLSPDKLDKVFGGCKKELEVCKKKSECCCEFCFPLYVVPVCGC